MSLLHILWNNRTMVMGVTQIILSQIATSGLVGDYAVKWLMLGTGILTGLIALHNTIRAKREQSQEPTE